MAYEVYIDVRHGDKHAMELDKASTCFKLSDVRANAPMEQFDEEGNLRYFKSPEQAVAYALRAYADELDALPEQVGDAIWEAMKVGR